MFIPKNRGFKRQYVYGGAGIFDSIANFFTRLFTSSAAKQITSTALDVGKTAALNGAQRLAAAAVTKVLTPKSPDVVAKKAQSILSKYINTDAQNINSLIDGSGVQQNAIAIQDLVRRLNGSGLKMI